MMGAVSDEDGAPFPPADGWSLRIERFPAEAASIWRVRQRVAAVLDEWGRSDLVDNAVLCAAELATNAVLHARGPFMVTVRRAGAGVRVEVVDDDPHQLPITVPRNGTAADLTRLSTTGRGLMIVAALAARWGFTATTAAKSVWAEVGGPEVDGREPVVSIDAAALDAPGPVHLRLTSVPVRAA